MGKPANLDLVVIGEITATHGNKGEVKVFPLTDFPERFRLLKEVFLVHKGESRILQVAGARFHKKFVLLKFREINNPTEAEDLKGAFLAVRKEEAFPLPEGSYYIFQLIGLPVFTLEGEYLGELKEVQRTGSNDVYVVVHPQTQAEVLIPALKEVVSSVDLAAKKILVKPLPGLLES